MWLNPGKEYVPQLRYVFASIYRLTIQKKKIFVVPNLITSRKCRKELGEKRASLLTLRSLKSRKSSKGTLVIIHCTSKLSNFLHQTCYSYRQTDKLSNEDCAFFSHTGVRECAGRWLKSFTNQAAKKITVVGALKIVGRNS